MSDKKEVIPFYNGDLRIKALYKAVVNVVYERGEGLPIATVLGTLQMVSAEILEASNGQS